MSYTGKRILITGGAGYLAAGLIRALQEVDCDIIRLVRPGRRARHVVGRARVRDWEGDVRCREVWESVLPDVQVVFHLAAQTSVYVAEIDARADQEANVLPMLHLLETCRVNAHRPIVVFAGTVTEAGIPDRVPVDETHPDRPITIYDLHKWMAESYLRRYAHEGIVRGVALRLANVYGPGPASSSADRGILNLMIRRAMRGENLTVYGSGEQMRDYLHVDDVSLAFLLAGSKIDQLNGEYFIIGSGTGHTIGEAITLVAERVAQRSGRRVDVIHVDPPTPQSPIEARNFVADSGRFSQPTGWRARYGLPDGIDRTIEVFLCES